MTENYIHIRVTYKANETVSATWALPESIRDEMIVDDSGDISAEDGDYDFPYREVTAFGHFTAEQVEAFRSEWSIDPDRAEAAMGFLCDLGDGVPRLYDDERHSTGGEEFNVGGWTPVLFADIFIIGPDAYPAGDKVKAAYRYAWAEITADIETNSWDVPDFESLHGVVDANEYLSEARDHVGLEDEDPFPFYNELSDMLDAALIRRYAS